jgi:selenophosphate synthetase-related protein
VVWWPSGGDDGLPPARARVYADFSTCLLTGEQGLASPGAAPVWAGLQDASADTTTKVSYLAAAGPVTDANYLPYLNSLVQRRCDVIVTVGQPGAAVASAQAASHPGIRFVIVGGSAQPAANVSPVGVSGHVREDVAGAVRDAAHAAGH